MKKGAERVCSEINTHIQAAEEEKESETNFGKKNKEKVPAKKKHG